VSSELESAKYTCAFEVLYTQVNANPLPEKSDVAEELKPTEALADPKHCAVLVMSSKPAS
jgi:hypothetical protein